MINYFNSFINNNLMIVLFVFIVAVLFTLLAKRIRKYIYTGLLTTLVPFTVALMHKFGFGFNGAFTLVERLFYTTFDNMERIQDVFLEKKDLLFFCVNFENEVLSLSIDFINNLHTNAIIIFRAISGFAKETKIEFINKFEYAKSEMVKGINLSRLSLVYRL